MIPWSSDAALYQYLILPLAIFCARVVDVSIGTIRVILLSRSARFVAPALGAIEVLIWLLAIGQIMKNLDNWLCYLAFALGFGAGNFLGLVIEARLALGLSLVRIIAPTGAPQLKRFLRRAGFRTTTAAARGSRGPVEIIFTIVRRRLLPRVEQVIRRHDPHAFYTIEDVRFASGSQSGESEPRLLGLPRRRLIPRRKGK